MSDERETCPKCGTRIFWVDGKCDAEKCEPNRPDPYGDRLRKQAKEAAL